ncbi:thiamine pyrophosphate-binding protein [Nocardia pseudobrasiliensis]|uniref:Sulfopyruvate decarboxylase subunit alpha n=1 Tax=Nocardia pseudobrasiliensis TaxID=45979 RepID=A0A370IDE1_9NOCA|nr:thiamine pyrophosphate-binding protein [Nocardia pseudobrasiliensis]RDI68736.1 sulfopyruvate decarboxylase subunit alpha [Nocardia pseudobrasiliensis]
MPPTSYATALARGIRATGADLIGYVPSVSVAPVVSALVEATGGAAGRSSTVFPLSREEEAAGLLGALPLAGRFGAIVMQDNGFGNALTALTTFNLAYHLPLLIVANTRGGLGEYNSMIHTFSQHAPALLDRLGIPVFELDRRSPAADWEAVVTEAGAHARMTFRPVVVLAHFWNTDGKGA